MDDRTTDYEDYVTSLGRTSCPCCGYATSYDRFLTCPLCDWAEPLAENAAWSVATSERDELLTEARDRYLTTGSALTPGDRATWAGELSSVQLKLRKELHKRPDELPDHSLESPDKPPPPEASHPRELSGVTRFANYLALVALLGIVADFVERRYGLEGQMIVLGELGLLFLLASIGRPWWLFATVRSVGWFQGVESDRSLKRILAVLGGLLVIVAVVAQLNA